MSYVFVSYSREDEALAERVVEWLEIHNYPHWWDRNLEAGTQFSTALKKALDDATYVAVIWTGASIKSDHVLDEAERARKARRLIPISTPGFGYSDLPIGFGSLQLVSIDKLDTLRTKLAGMATSTPPQAQSAGAKREPNMGTIGAILHEMERKFRRRVALSVITVCATAGLTFMVPELAIAFGLGALVALGAVYALTQ